MHHSKGYLRDASSVFTMFLWKPLVLELVLVLLILQKLATGLSDSVSPWYTTT